MMHTVPRDARDFGSLICKAWCVRGRPSTEWPFDPDIVEVWNESFWNVLNLTIMNSSVSGFKDSPNASMLPWQLSNPDTTWPQSLKRKLASWHQPSWEFPSISSNENLRKLLQNPQPFEAHPYAVSCPRFQECSEVHKAPHRRMLGVPSNRTGARLLGRISHQSFCCNNSTNHILIDDLKWHVSCVFQCVLLMPTNPHLNIPAEKKTEASGNPPNPRNSTCDTLRQNSSASGPSTKWS